MLFKFQSQIKWNDVLAYLFCSVNFQSFCEAPANMSIVVAVSRCRSNFPANLIAAWLDMTTSVYYRRNIQISCICYQYGYFITPVRAINLMQNYRIWNRFSFPWLTRGVKSLIRKSLTTLAKYQKRFKHLF